MAVTTANISDRDGAIFMFEKHKKKTFKSVKNIMFDGGYRGDKFAKSIKEICNSTVEVIKRNELHKFKIIPKRWVVERSFAWLEKCRRLWKDAERKLVSSRAMMQFAFLALLIKRL